MVKVTLGGATLATSDQTIQVEGNHYFPPSALDSSLFTKSDTKTHCGWKGEASYYNANIDGKTYADVAWYYPQTITDRAKPVENYVAFYKNKVNISEAD
ncbi:DUF427-domain-containing protein [Coprinopsis marcescibilis]|uniref:DUF427-domain-containing protein n=1 Tax=Coprinopsis marcescibilis TaxID=230819 RepID=A0A5C3L4F8_COPMA|nr:DUF427-domain-containing protein [Coprinopsis marcescibilis]